MPLVSSTSKYVFYILLLPILITASPFSHHSFQSEIPLLDLSLLIYICMLWDAYNSVVIPFPAHVLFSIKSMTLFVCLKLRLLSVKRTFCRIPYLSRLPYHCMIISKSCLMTC